MIDERLKKLHYTVSYKIGQRDLILKEQQNLQGEEAALKLSLSIKQNVKQLIELFVKGTEYRLREAIEPIITEGFHYVFEQDLFFHIYFSSRRNQVEIDLPIIRSKAAEEVYQKLLKDPIKNEKQIKEYIKEFVDINDSFGGSINQVLAVLLKIILAELLKIKGPLEFDEPTSMVSEAEAGRLGNLISSLSKKYNRQYIFVTHSTTLASCADKLYRVEQTNGISKVKEEIR